MILTVDLAAKFSAALVRDRDSGEVHRQFDSMNKSHFGFAAEIGRIAREDEIEMVVIEDVPYNPKYTQAMVKPVLKFQGVMIAVLHPVLEKVAFLDPSAWMRMFPGVQRAPKGLTKAESDKYRIEQARQHAANLGYEPPDLVQQYIDSLPEGKKILKKDTAPLEKAMTDYVSAFLMSEFVRSMSPEQFRSLQGVSPAYI